MDQAVIYARYSSDKQRDSSIDDQVRNCKTHAEKLGVPIGRIYADQAISGSRSDRPEYNEMLLDADGGKFTTLIVDDMSRLSRNRTEVLRIADRFRYKGLRIVAVAEGYDSSQGKTAKIQESIGGLMNEMYLEDLRDKTHRGMTGRALLGKNTGGRVYGYDNVPIEDETRRDEYGRPLVVGAIKRINEEQAQWVQKIYEWYADGMSSRAIAIELNRLGVPAPRSGSWSLSSIYGDMKKGVGILNNPLYIGVYMWNRSKWIKDPDTGKRKRVMRDEDAQIKLEMEELRIIPQALWDKVKARQIACYAKSENLRAALGKHARAGAPAKYLFSGMLKCGCCGSNFIVTDYYRYGCARHRDRGPTECSNNLKVTRKTLDAVLLKSLREDLFTEAGIRLFRNEANKLLKERAEQLKPDVAGLKRKLGHSEKSIANLLAALKAGVDSTSIKDELLSLELEKKGVQAQIEAAEAPKASIDPLLPRAVERYAQLITQLESLSSPPATKIKKTIEDIMGGEIVLRPNEGNTGLTADLCGDYAGLLRLSEKSELSVVAGVGFEPTTFRL